MFIPLNFHINIEKLTCSIKDQKASHLKQPLALLNILRRPGGSMPVNALEH